MKRILLVVSLLFPLMITAPTGAVAPPASCTFDPALGGAGVVTTEDPNDGYRLDRMALDREGRLYTISNVVVNDEYVLDRVRRFEIDGSTDPTWGTGGFVDLPGQMFSIRGRALAVDDLGRVWIVRNSFSDVREVLRLTAEGRVDMTLPAIEFQFPTNTFGPVGDIQPDGEGVVIGQTVRVNAGSGIQFVRINGDGVVVEHTFSRGIQGLNVFVTRVDPSGWVAGQVQVTQGSERPPSPMLWAFSGTDQPYFYIHRRVGTFTTLMVNEGVVTAVGNLDDGSGDSIGTGISFEFGPSVPSYFGVNGGSSDGTDVVDSESGLLPLAVFADRRVMGLTGEVGSADVFVGRLDVSNQITIESTLPNVGAAFFPGASTTRDDGSFVVAGYRGLEARRAFVAALTPELGPEVSASALDDQILRLYEAYYLRAPDAGGRAFWREQRASGRSLEAISAQFAGAPEFGDLYGDLTNAAFVDLIYTNVLGRLGDEEGRAFWTSQLDEGERTRGSVMLEFSESAENLDRTSTVAAHDDETGSVYRLYNAYFDRAPDAGGSCFWVRRLVGGASLDQVSDSFASSQEFVDTYGALSNREFVELVYSNVLGRPGEAAGVDFWTGELDADRRTRGQVMIGFSESPEYIERTGTLPVSS